MQAESVSFRLIALHPTHRLDASFWVRVVEEMHRTGESFEDNEGIEKILKRMDPNAYNECSN